MGVFSREENNILYRGVDELLEKKFLGLYLEFIDMFTDNESIDEKNVVTDEQELF